MPRRYRSFKKRTRRTRSARRVLRKRGYGNYRRVRRSTRRVPLMWPSKKRIHLRYVDDTNGYIDNTGTTGFGYTTVRLNGLYDVNPGTGNVAVPGFEPYTTMYTRYRVVTAKLVVRFDNYNNQPIRVGIVAATPNQATDIATLDRSEALALQGNNECKWRTLNSYNSGSNSSTVLKKTWRLSKLFSQPLEYFSDADWTGNATNNPAKYIIAYIYAFTHNGVAGNATVNMSYTVDMWVDVFDRKRDFP